MRTLSLFSGIGGFDLGFERAGMTVVGVCEIDKHAQKILKRHFPEATLHTDVRDVHYERGTVDLICGGFPCQDLSVAGKRRGLDGERSGLWFEFARIIDEAEPEWVVIENVPGLFSSDGGRDFAIIIQWLAQRGYGVGWRVLDAQGFGLAQRRKRVFIIASFGSQRGCTVLLEPKSVRWHHTPSRRTGQGDTAATAKCLTAGSGIQGRTMNLIPDVAKCLLGSNHRRDYETETMIPFAIQGNINAPLAIGVLWESSHADDPVRICTDQTVAPTLQVYKEATPLIGVRRLTPTECERLQGFPDGWTSGQSDTHRYKQLGNAVAVPVAEWIGHRIMEQS